jgi:cell division protein FtsN
MKFQRGGFAIGLVVGLLTGLALALGVALYITKAPVPFVNKVPQRTAEQDNAEAERNKTWDPNAPLSGKPGARPAAPAAAASASPQAAAPVAAPTATAKPGRDPAAILSAAPSTAAGAEPFMYFVQVGAFTRADDAEQQRARLAMLGYAAKVTEREQSGRTVFRVRAGPYDSRDEADGAQVRLQEAGVDARLVRVERP